MIRVAQPADVEVLAAINHEVQELHRAAIPDRYRDASLAEIAAHLHERLADPDSAVHVAEQDAAVVGYVILRRVDFAGHVFALPRRTANVDQLAVAARAHRSGHGRALMAAAEAQARTWGAVALTLDVQAFNAEAIAFYDALGYRPLSNRVGKSL
jgi:diamine N-acetyltransferase